MSTTIYEYLHYFVFANSVVRIGQVQAIYFQPELTCNGNAYHLHI